MSTVAHFSRQGGHQRYRREGSTAAHYGEWRRHRLQSIINQRSSWSNPLLWSPEWAMKNQFLFVSSTLYLAGQIKQRKSAREHLRWRDAIILTDSLSQIHRENFWFLLITSLFPPSSYNWWRGPSTLMFLICYSLLLSATTNWCPFDLVSSSSRLI